MHIAEKLAFGELTLPVLSSLTRSLLRLIETGANTAAIAEVVKQDAVLSGRVVALANSVFYGGTQSARSVAQAIGRIGISSLKNLALAEAQKSSYLSSEPALAEYLKALWRHSLACALVAEKIAKKKRLPDSDAAFLAALLHDIGKTAIVSILPGGPKVTPWPPTSIIDEMHTQIVSNLLAQWTIPADIIQAIEGHHKCATNPGVLTAIVHVADVVCHRVGLAPNARREAQVDAQAKLQLGLSDIALAELEVDVEDRVAEFDAVLGGIDA
jgi:putative nucleotidyltransferase with HDIG domain